MPIYFRSIVAVLLLSFSPLALAHSPIKGIGSFFNGILHPLLVPEQILTILAVGLLFGQHKPADNTRFILLFLLACILGLIATAFGLKLTAGIYLLLLALLAGGLIMLSPPLPWFVVPIMGILAGFIIGLDSSVPELSNKEKIATLFGSGVGIYFSFLYAVALSESLTNKAWQVIAVKVLASWLSASALMVLALSFA